MEAGKYLFRQVRTEEDAKGIIKLVRESGYHSDNLPRNNPSLIRANVALSSLDFAKANPGGNKKPLFMFVLVDTDTGKVVGTSLIKSLPYCLAYEIYFDQQLGEYVGELALKPKEGVWELGGLLLSKEVRGRGLAKLLSYGRLAYLATKNLKPRMLISGFFRDSFWAYVTNAIGAPKNSDVAFHWSNLETMSKFMGLLPSRILMKDAGIVYASRNDLEIPVSIQPEPEPARKLLTDMLFRQFNEIEANGVFWYGGAWQTIRTVFMSHEVPSDRIQIDSCKAACHNNMGIAVLPSDDFRAQYVPLELDGQVFISGRDFPCGKPKHLFMFNKN